MPTTKNEGVMIQVIPSLVNDNETVSQLISLVHDISTNKMREIMKHRKEFLNFKNAKENIATIMNILSKQPNTVSYEVYGDGKIISFNFWIPKKVSNTFIKKIYGIWDGGQVQVIKDDYIKGFDIEKTLFSTIKFGSESYLPVSGGEGAIETLVRHLESLEIDEKVLIQFLMKPVEGKWHKQAPKDVVNKVMNQFRNGEDIGRSGGVKNTLKAVVEAISDTVFIGYSKNEKKKSMNLGLRQKEIKQIVSKLNKRGIQVNIRVSVESESRERSEALMNGITEVFNIISGGEYGYNKFIREDILPINKVKMYDYMKQRKVPIVTIGGKDIWINEEIVNFVRMPTKEINSGKVERITLRQTFTPEELKLCSGLRLGTHTYRGKTNMLYWDIRDKDTLMRPTVVISNPGEGKSEMLKSKFFDWIKLGYGAAVIDVADGKVIDQILYQLDEKDKERVVLVDCNDINNPPALSNFSEAGEGASDRQVSALLSQLWTEFYMNYFNMDDHHRSKDFIRKSSVPIFSFEENTILEQYLMISNESFRGQFITKMHRVKRLKKYAMWWEHFNDRPFKIRIEETKPVLNKFDLIMDNEFLKNIICQREPLIPKFRQIMDERKILLIKAGEGAIGYEASRIIGALSLMKLWMALLSRHDIPEEERIMFKIFADEPQNYLSAGDYVKEMLAKMRKYRGGIEMYFQDPNQIAEKDSHLLKLIVNSNPHLFLGKMGETDYRKYFKHRIAPILSEEGAVLPKHHWIVSMYRDKEAIPPFIMQAVDKVPNATKERIAERKVWIDELRKKYTRPVEEVEDDIMMREMVGFNIEEENEPARQMHGNATTI